MAARTGELIFLFVLSETRASKKTRKWCVRFWGRGGEDEEGGGGGSADRRIADATGRDKKSVAIRVDYQHARVARGAVDAPIVCVELDADGDDDDCLISSSGLDVEMVRCRMSG